MAATPTKNTLHVGSHVPITRSTAEGISVLMVYIKMPTTKCWKAPARVSLLFRDHRDTRTEPSHGLGRASPLPARGASLVLGLRSAP